MSLENPLTVLYKEVNGSKITTEVYLPSNTSASPQMYPVGGSSFISLGKYIFLQYTVLSGSCVHEY